MIRRLAGAAGAVLRPPAADLNKPLVVIAVKDEISMKALAPSYWEQKNGVRPATV